MSTRKSQSIASILIAAAFWLLALAPIGCGASDYRSGPFSSARRHPMPSLASRFRILRSPGRGTSKLMADRMHLATGIHLQAHRSTTPNGPIWMVLGTEGEVCLFAGSPPENICEPASFALHHGIALGIVEHPADPSNRSFVLCGVGPDRSASESRSAIIRPRESP